MTVSEAEINFNDGSTLADLYCALCVLDAGGDQGWGSVQICETSASLLFANIIQTQQCIYLDLEPLFEGGVEVGRVEGGFAFCVCQPLCVSAPVERRRWLLRTQLQPVS